MYRYSNTDTESSNDAHVNFILSLHHISHLPHYICRLLFSSSLEKMRQLNSPPGRRLITMAIRNRVNFNNYHFCEGIGRNDKNAFCTGCVNSLFHEKW